jgi:ATP-dependent Clp protease adaptor protein ClpS
MSDNKTSKYDLEERLLTQERVKIKRPNMYKIVLLNDDYTPREFVVWVLIKVFYKSEHESLRIMLDAHTKGKSIVGVYTHDVARTKVIQVDKLSEQNGHPLKCVIEVEQGEED